MWYGSNYNTLNRYVLMKWLQRRTRRCRERWRSIRHLELPEVHSRRNSIEHRKWRRRSFSAACERDFAVHDILSSKTPGTGSWRHHKSRRVPRMSSHSGMSNTFSYFQKIKRDSHRFNSPNPVLLAEQPFMGVMHTSDLFFLMMGRFLSQLCIRVQFSSWLV
jgi:hypothetical protein